MERPPDQQSLIEIEQTLSRATMRLGRLRGRHRGSALHRDLTAVFYDVQAARLEVVRLLGDAGPTDEA
jgi:hypothetical protein